MASWLRHHVAHQPVPLLRSAHAQVNPYRTSRLLHSQRNSEVIEYYVWEVENSQLLQAILAMDFPNPECADPSKWAD